MDGHLLVLATQRCRSRIDLLEHRRVLVELARVGRAEQRLVKNCHIGDAADAALEMKAVAFPELSLPAALGLLRQRVKPSRDIPCGIGRRARISENAGREYPGNRCLLHHLAAVPAVQPIEQIADGAGLLHELLEVAAGTMLA